MIWTQLERDVIAVAHQAPSERLNAIWRAYETSVGVELERPPTNGQRSEVASWLKSRRPQTDIELFVTKTARLRHLAHRTPAEKAGRLMQGSCGACELVTWGESGQTALAIQGPINVEPWSAQTSAGKVAIRQAVTAKMQERNWHQPVSDQAICLTVVSFVPRRRGKMDVDNLVKGLLDSLQGVLYVNDRQVQCLTSRRLLTDSRTGAYLLSARVVYPYSEDVVYDDGSPLNIPFERIDVKLPSD